MLTIPLYLYVSKVRGALGAHCLRAGADILRGLRDAEGLAIHRQVQVRGYANMTWKKTANLSKQRSMLAFDIILRWHSVVAFYSIEVG